MRKMTPPSNTFSEKGYFCRKLKISRGALKHVSPEGRSSEVTGASNKSAESKLKISRGALKHVSPEGWNSEVTGASNKSAESKLESPRGSKSRNNFSYAKDKETAFPAA